MNKLETLQAALISRDEEIESYQINIDNYERGIEKIDATHLGNPEMVKFRENLSGLLASSKTEQLKASIIREVIADQLAEMESN